MKRPRVAFDVTPLLYTGGGIRRSTESLLGALFARENEFDLVPFGRRLLGGPFLFERKDRRCKRLRLPRSAEGLIKAFGLVEASCRADLYHATDFYMPLRSGSAAIATIHDVIFLCNPEPGADHVRLARWAGKFAVQSKAIMTCSQWTRNALCEAMNVDPAKIHVIYWGVDHDRFFPDRDEVALRSRLLDALQIERPYFLAVSCSMHRKNTPRLLRAYAELLKRGVSTNLVVVWDAPNEIRQTYQALVTQGRIRFTGRVDDRTLRDLYAGATATLYPSLDEGFGLPLLESMSCGTPVIAARASCLPEIAGDAALYVDPFSEQSMIDAMERFENRDPSLAELREKGINHAATFTWARCAEQTAEVYRQTLASL
jgi:glycosyltransferase involved in cell wall biosynthesis